MSRQGKKRKKKAKKKTSQKNAQTDRPTKGQTQTPTATTECTQQHNTTQHNTWDNNKRMTLGFHNTTAQKKKKFNFSRTVVGRWRSTVPETNHWTDTRFSTGTKYFPKGELWA